MVNKVKDAYDNGECPDCGEPISDEMVEGGECHNCGHVFWSGLDLIGDDDGI